MTYLNLRHREFKEDHQKWYNLDTGRFLKDSGDKLILEHPRVVSTKLVILLEFIQLNNLKWSEIRANEFLLQNLKKIHKDRQVELIKTPTQELAERLSLLTLAPKNVRAKGLVTDIIDGDTLKILISVNLDQLAYKHTRDGAQCAISKPNVLMHCKLNCRLFGLDMAEKDTEKGRLGTNLLKDLCAKYRNELFVEMMGKGVYGRTLVRLYPQHVSDFCLNGYLLNYRDPVWGRLAIKYFGESYPEHTQFKKTCNQPDDPILEMKPISLPDYRGSLQDPEDTSYCKCIIM